MGLWWRRYDGIDGLRVQVCEGKRRSPRQVEYEVGFLPWRLCLGHFETVRDVAKALEPHRLIPSQAYEESLLLEFQS